MRMDVVTVALAVLAGGCGGTDQDDAPPPEAVQVADAQVAQAADVQVVQVRVQGNEYRFSPETVHAGMLVRLAFDPKGLPGCSRSVTLPDYDIAKTIEEGDTTIEFTPSEGPIAVACSMNMFTGTLVAE